MPCPNRIYSGEQTSPTILREQLKRIGSLSRQGMDAGNKGDFETAFSNMDKALTHARNLNKKCLEAKILNNLGILYTLRGNWDEALLYYDKSMNIVVESYGVENFLYKTLQKNILYLFTPRATPQAQ